MDEKLPNIDKRLIEAYRAAHYRVLSFDLTIRVDAFHPQLDAWLEQHDHTRWAYLTAVNPRSQFLTAQENQLRQANLQDRLHVGGHPAFPALALDVAAIWPPEPSFWVPGLYEVAAYELAHQFDQNAFLYGEYQQTARLVWVKK